MLRDPLIYTALKRPAALLVLQVSLVLLASLYSCAAGDGAGDGNAVVGRAVGMTTLARIGSGVAAAEGST